MCANVPQMDIENIKKEYVGKWIALREEKVVAVSDSHDEIYKRLKEKNINGAYVFYSPTDEEKKYSFLFHLRVLCIWT